jgi:hypothetical protein
LEGIVLIEHTPIDSEQIARAAEELIAKHGDSAIAQANKLIGTCESQGLGSVAENWKLIREVIRDAQQSDPTIIGYKKALKSGVILSE